MCIGQSQFFWHSVIVQQEKSLPKPFFVILLHGTISDDLSGPNKISATISTEMFLIKNDENTEYIEVIREQFCHKCDLTCVQS